MLIDNYPDKYKKIVNRMNCSTLKPNELASMLEGTSIFIKYGRFSKEEQNCVHAAIKEFLESENYTMDDFVRHIKIYNRTSLKYSFSLMEEIDNFPFRGLCRFVASRIDLRDHISIKRYILEAYDTNTQIYSKEDDLILLAQAKSTGNQYKVINEILQKKFRSLERRHLKLTGKKIANPEAIFDEIEKITKSHQKVTPSLLAKNLKTTYNNITSAYQKFLRISLQSDWNETPDAFILLFILKYNYYAHAQVDIKKLYTDFENEEIYNDTFQKLIESSALSDNRDVRLGISSEIVNEKFVPGIDRERCGRKVEFDNIFFHNIVIEWNSVINKVRVHKSLLLPKIRALFLEHEIKTYLDVFEAYKKCIKLAFETKLLEKTISTI